MTNHDINPRPAESWPDYVRRAWPALAAFEYDGPEITKAEADAFMLGHLTALARLHYDGDSTPIITAMLHRAHRGHTARHFVQRLLAEAQLSEAERLIAEVEEEDLDAITAERIRAAANKTNVDPGFGDADIERAEGNE